MNDFGIILSLTVVGALLIGICYILGDHTARIERLERAIKRGAGVRDEEIVKFRFREKIED